MQRDKKVQKFILLGSVYLYLFLKQSRLSTWYYKIVTSIIFHIDLWRFGNFVENTKG